MALSRCRSLEGLVIASKINDTAIINDVRVDNYISRQEENAENSIRQLPLLKQNYHRQLVIELFDFRNLQSAEDQMLRLMLEFFSGTNPALTQLHRQTAAELKEKVTDISMKWLKSIATYSYEDLNSQQGISRDITGANLFIDRIAYTV